MKRNADGSLTIHVQKASPGKAKEPNWLPAPDGPIYLVMRLYWPKDTPPSILPPCEGRWKPPPDGGEVGPFIHLWPNASKPMAGLGA